jgi:hypothetical protein
VCAATSKLPTSYSNISFEGPIDFDLEGGAIHTFYTQSGISAMLMTALITYCIIEPAQTKFEWVRRLLQVDRCTIDNLPEKEQIASFIKGHYVKALLQRELLPISEPETNLPRLYVHFGNLLVLLGIHWAILDYEQAFILEQQKFFKGRSSNILLYRQEHSAFYNLGPVVESKFKGIEMYTLRA